MKFENLMMRGLFLAALLACGLTFLAMLRPSHGDARALAAAPVAAVLSSAQIKCALPADGVLCPLHPEG